jgi:membrane protein insertase Oxa1/YidC/SpoIIIJ
MSDEQKSLWGCIGLITIALLVGIALRSQNIKQFLVMCGEIVIGIMALVWGLSSLSEDGCLNRLWTIFCGLVTLTMVTAVGAFLITGDYERATRIANWYISTPTPGSDEQAQVETTPTATPTPQPTPTPTATPTPVIISTPASTPAVLAAGDRSWLAETKVPVEKVTEALNEIWDASAPDAVQMANRLNAGLEMASVEGKYAAGLLIAATHERAEDLDAAYFAYEQVKEEAADTPYATSADVRLCFLPVPELTPSAESGEEAEELNPLERLQRLKGKEPKDPEEICEAILDEPDAEGWFLLSEQWLWDTTRRVASQALVDMRADDLSFRFFQFLRLQSPFPKPYAYMFILLAMTIGVKILALPLYIRTARTAIRMRRLQPEIQLIQSVHGDDPMAMQRRLAEFYQKQGLNVGSGCAVFIVDLIFVIWALVALGSFSPQLILDDAKFFWVSDVTQRNFGILLVWEVLNLLQVMITSMSQQMRQQLRQLEQQWGQQFDLPTGWLSCSVVIGAVVSTGVAWYLKWPTYVFVFWILLSVLGILINGVLKAIGAMMK